MKMKGILLCLLVVLITGCTVVRIDTTSIDNILNVVLTKDNQVYNYIGVGYKYYIPRGVSYIDSSGSNDKLYSNGIYYYLYLDKINYFYKNKGKHTEDRALYYSKNINIDNKEGYLDITKVGNNYLIQFDYNYARIEVYAPEDEIENVVLNSSYILSTIKYNKSVIKLELENNSKSEEKYEEFTSKKETNSFLSYEEK